MLERPRHRIRTGWPFRSSSRFNIRASCFRTSQAVRLPERSICWAVITLPPSPGVERAWAAVACEHAIAPSRTEVRTTGCGRKGFTEPPGEDADDVAFQAN